MSDLLRIISLLYRMQSEDVTALTQQLLDHRKQAWLNALTDKAREYGCSRLPNAPRREDLAELRRMCAEDATSIAATWNRDVERQLEKLYNANPRGNRTYYAKNMTEWERARAQWKTPQIALQTEQTTRAYTQDRFRQENGMRGGRYVAAGPPPVCGTCIGYFAAGVVTEAFIQRNHFPAHVGCPHEWRELAATAPTCAEMWLG